MHALAYIVWPLVSVHFIMMGTDAMATWSLAMIGVVSGLLVLLLLRRGLSRPNVPFAAMPAKLPAVELNFRAAAPNSRSPRSSKRRQMPRPLSSACRTHAAAFRYLPGQFTLRVPSDLTGSVARCCLAVEFAGH